MMLSLVSSLLIDATARVSNYFSKVDSLSWTSYLEECLNSLSQNNTVQNDLLLAHFTRLQLIENKISQIPGLQRVCENAGSTSVNWPFYLRAMQAELKACRATISSDLQQDGKPDSTTAPRHRANPHDVELLLLYLFSTEAKVHEIAFSDPTKDHKGIEPLRIGSLYTVLEATKNWFDIYLDFPPAHYVRFPLWISTQLAHAIVTLYRLSIFDHPGWDQTLTKETCNLSEVIDAVTHRMTQVKLAAGLVYDDEPSHTRIFEVNVRKLTFIKTWWHSKDNSQRHDPSAAAPASETADKDAMDASGDAWLNDFLMMENFQFESFVCSTGGTSQPPEFGL